MDNVRLILIMLLLFLGLMLYQAWQEDYGPGTPAVAGTPAATTGNAPPAVATAIGSLAGNPDDILPQPAAGPATTADLPATAITGRMDSVGRVQVETDVLHAEIDLRGGDLRVIKLPGYPVKVDTPDNPYVLMDDRAPLVFVVQSGLLDQTDSANAPTHKALYRAEQDVYTLESGDNSLQVVLHWEDDARGLAVTKIYEFQRGDYVIKLRHIVNNESSTPWNTHLYGQLRRTEWEDAAGGSRFIYTYLGGAISGPEARYEKIKFDAIRSNSFNKENREPWTEGWLAMLQHYFVAAIVPPADDAYHYYTRYVKDQGHHVLGLYGPGVQIPPGSSETLDMQLYVGPKLQHRLADLSPNLNLTVDYGWLWFLAQPLFWGLEKLHALLNNWGLAIIGLTILIKLLFFYPSAISYKSMANLRKLQPRLQALKERYGDDRTAFNQAMMDLYRTEKINPLGGCLPILIQIPVFIALYWVLLESVELRQAPFMGWIKDMSQPDPLFILPLIMGVTMIIQHKLNPAPLDPVQQKVMMVLPLVFTVFFAFFPSGLVLYWVVNNMLSITQQWYITRQIAGGVK